MTKYMPLHIGSERDADNERISIPRSAEYVPIRTVVARPTIEAEASWWEDNTRVEIRVRREAVMGGETLEESMRHVQRIIDILLNDLDSMPGGE